MRDTTFANKLVSGNTGPVTPLYTAPNVPTRLAIRNINRATVFGFNAADVEQISEATFLLRATGVSSEQSIFEVVLAPGQALWARGVNVLPSSVTFNVSEALPLDNRIW